MRNAFMESLEDRCLLTGVTAAVNGYGALTVTGTANADVITVNEKSGAATVYDHGVAIGTWSAVKSVTINALAGADTIKYTGYDFGATINGGDGNDAITVTDYEVSTAFHSYVDGGAGADNITLLTGTGCSVHGGLDNDTISIQGGSNNQVWGDGGTDTINVSTGVTGTTVHKDSLDKITNRGTNTVLTLT